MVTTSPQGATKRTPREGTGGAPRRFVRRKICRFCSDKIDRIDEKDIIRIKRFVTERGKIVPRRISGTCARHQRQLQTAIKRGRNIGLIAYTAE
ncbi:MAG: 30S ribosomal protein S18 [bacterium]|nr:30S ribosomal protein S18 [bacterium]